MVGREGARKRDGKVEGDGVSVPPGPNREIGEVPESVGRFLPLLTSRRQPLGPSGTWFGQQFIRTLG